MRKNFTVYLDCKPITKAEFSIDAVAEWLASEYDEVQAEFFNLFDKHLRSRCNGSHAMQIHRLREYLTPDAKYTMADIGSDK